MGYPLLTHSITHSLEGGLFASLSCTCSAIAISITITVVVVVASAVVLWLGVVCSWLLLSCWVCLGGLRLGWLLGFGWLWLRL